MSSNRRPWYPWYPKDFIVDEKVQSLSPLAELIYRRALDVMWQANDCQLPNVSSKLANQLGKGLTQNQFDDALSEIQHPGFELFKTSDCGNWLYSKRLKLEAEKIENIQKKRSQLGKKGAQAKAKAKAKQLVKQSASHTDTYTYNSNTPPTPPRGKHEYSKSFEQWWELYPRKVGKGAAYKSWGKIGKNGEATVNELCEAIKDQIAHKHFRNGNGEDYIPNPSTWLNQRRWEDEIIQKNKPPTNSMYNFPVCQACGVNGSNITQGQPCPYCDEIA
jgi:hypothetical protein